MYLHSSYFWEDPRDFLIDEKGRNIDANRNLTDGIEVKNPYKKELDEKWIEGPDHNLNRNNPSLPDIVQPTRPRRGVK